MEEDEDGTYIYRGGSCAMPESIGGCLGVLRDCWGGSRYRTHLKSHAGSKDCPSTAQHTAGIWHNMEEAGAYSCLLSAVCFLLPASGQLDSLVLAHSLGAVSQC